MIIITIITVIIIIAITILIIFIILCLIFFNAIIHFYLLLSFPHLVISFSRWPPELQGNLFFKICCKMLGLYSIITSFLVLFLSNILCKQKNADTTILRLLYSLIWIIINKIN